MCRFIAYLGKPLLVDDILYKPKNSLINQSYHAKEMKEPLNGDGFGLGWYTHQIDLEPGLFTSTRPAWNNRNLMYLAPKIRSDCFFAHVRAASKGGITQYNCHPFHYKRFLFMHNGTIRGFEKIKRDLRHCLADEFYDWIKGQTDSEHFFALFLNIFAQRNLDYSIENMATVMPEAIAKIADFKKKNKIDSTTYINAVVTNGKVLMAVRYVSDPNDTARTLYYAAGKEFTYHDGHTHMIPSEDVNGAILVVSEKLTSYKCEWQEISQNHLLTVNEDLAISLRPLF